VRIDAFTHVLPEEYKRQLFEIIPTIDDGVLAAVYMSALPIDPGLFDLERRFADMDAVGGDYRQVLTLSTPMPEEFAEPQLAAELSRLANDEMAAMVAAHPDRFVGFGAQLPMNDTELAVQEAKRALALPGVLGIQLGANILGRPLDHPDFEPVIAMVAEGGYAIWLHPTRPPTMPDYLGEDASQYALWFSIGWPYDTSLAMARLVFSGVLERYPNLTVIAHLAGGMVPHFAPRLAVPLQRLAVPLRASGSDGSGRTPLTKPPLEYFHRFYGDTVTRGNAPALRTAVDFFGPDHMHFGTDGNDARMVTDEIVSLGLSDKDQRLIFEGTARRILQLVNV